MSETDWSKFDGQSCVNAGQVSMSVDLGFFSIVVVSLVLSQSLTENHEARAEAAANSSLASGQMESSHRQAKYLFIVRTNRDPCQSKLDGGLIGNCYSFKECKQSEGNFGGFCAFGVGFCCVFMRSCGSTIQHNNTYFQSREFPSAFTPSGLESCTANILKPSNNICQVRLDFLSTELEGPDENGLCQKDRIIFSPGAIPGTSTGILPSNLCGPLSGQSIYLDFGTSKHMSLTFVTDGHQSTSQRKWNVKTSYIQCNSPLAAPSGCLQYRTGVVGQVRILGYPQAPHLGNLGYSVCVRAEDRARGISWRRCTGEPEDQSFWFTGGPVSTAGVQATANCNGDFVLIPTTFDPGTTSDRHCGNSLSAVSASAPLISYDKPFILRVKTDAIEGLGEQGNTGFCLEWNQHF